MGKVYKSNASGESFFRSAGSVKKFNSNLSFKAPFNDYGVDRLDPILTINNVSMAPTFRYKGGDASATSLLPWGYGEALPRVAVATQPSYNSGSPYRGSKYNNGYNDSVIFNESDFYQDAAAVVGDITLEDIIIEGWIHTGVKAASTVCAKISSAGGAGWRIILQNGTSLSLQLYDGATSKQMSYTTLLANTWNHFMFIVDRSGYGICFVNGLPGSELDVSALVAQSITTAQKFTIGAYSNGANNADCQLGYLAMWKSTGWLDHCWHPEIAEERFYKLTGQWADHACGGQRLRSASRTTLSYIDNIKSSVRKMYPIGKSIMRAVSRTDGAGGVQRGLLNEKAVTNLFSKSCSVDHADWTKTNAATIHATTSIGPDPGNPLQGIVGQVGDSAYGVTQAPVLTAANYTVSCMVSVGAQTFCYLLNSTIANGTAWFNLTTGAVGTTEAGVVNATIEDWGSGVFRISATYLGTAAGHTVGIFAADGDNDLTFTGDGTATDLYVGNLQCELDGGELLPTNFVYTDAASATKNNDAFYYWAIGNVGGQGDTKQGTIKCDIVAPNINVTSSRPLLSINTGASSTERIELYLHSTDAISATVVTLSCENYSAATTGSTDIADGLKHELKMTWKNGDRVRVYVDGVLEATSSAICLIPVNLDRLILGSSYNNADHGGMAGIVINNFKIYKDVV